MGFDYSSSNQRWQRLKNRALQRDRHRCREAARFGRMEAATHVHHIWPAEDYPEYAYCLWNLVSLTKENHDAMHDRRSGRLTLKGLAWKNRTPPPSDLED